MDNANGQATWDRGVQYSATERLALWRDDNHHFGNERGARQTPQSVDKQGGPSQRKKRLGQERSHPLPFASSNDNSVDSHSSPLEQLIPDTSTSPFTRERKKYAM